MLGSGAEGALHEAHRSRGGGGSGGGGEAASSALGCADADVGDAWVRPLPPFPHLSCRAPQPSSALAPQQPHQKNAEVARRRRRPRRARAAARLAAQPQRLQRLAARAPPQQRRRGALCLRHQLCGGRGGGAHRGAGAAVMGRARMACSAKGRLRRLAAPLVQRLLASVSASLTRASLEVRCRSASSHSTD
jgi:hypothetical protein